MERLASEAHFWSVDHILIGKKKKKVSPSCEAH